MEQHTGSKLGKEYIKAIYCHPVYLTYMQWPQDWKRSVFTPIPKKGNAQECSNYCTIALISHTSKVMLKFLQVRLQQYMNHEPPDVQAVFRKGRRTRDQIANIHCIMEKALHHVTLDKLCFSGHCAVRGLHRWTFLFYPFGRGAAEQTPVFRPEKTPAAETPHPPTQIPWGSFLAGGLSYPLLGTRAVVTYHRQRGGERAEAQRRAGSDRSQDRPRGAAPSQAGVPK